MRSTIIAVLLTLFCATAMAEPSPPPRVMVSFVVESPIFRDDLVEENGTSRVLECETRVAEAMLATLAGADLFPYLKWATSGTGDYTFKATLRDESGGGDADTLIVYEGDTGEAIPAHKLFGWSESYDREPGPLIEEIIKRVKADLQGASKATIESNFAKRVVLVTTVDIKPQPSKTVVVPVAGVMTNDDSILRVSFENPANEPGFMLLRRPLPAPAGIFCRVAVFSLDDVDANDWDNRIPAKMGTAQNVRVTMEVFRRRTYANTTDGSVDVPD